MSGKITSSIAFLKKVNKNFNLIYKKYKQVKSLNLYNKSSFSKRKEFFIYEVPNKKYIDVFSLSRINNLRYLYVENKLLLRKKYTFSKTYLYLLELSKYYESLNNLELNFNNYYNKFLLNLNNNNNFFELQNNFLINNNYLNNLAYKYNDGYIVPHFSLFFSKYGYIPILSYVNELMNDCEFIFIIQEIYKQFYINKIKKWNFDTIIIESFECSNKYFKIYDYLYEYFILLKQIMFINENNLNIEDLVVMSYLICEKLYNFFSTYTKSVFNNSYRENIGFSFFE